MTADEIATVLASHANWINGAGGSRADLNGADLREADLREAYLNGANLRRADLRGADLRGAYLNGANLSGADLSGAYLRRANLSGADLSGANLLGADLSGANLRRANLSGADLRGAYLRGSDLRRANMPTGETYEVYLSEVVPQLLLAGERGLDAVRLWGKHSWQNCPIHNAFSITNIDQAPALLRPRILQFVQFYDAGLIPQPIQMLENANDA